jgi:hypothetical protein
MASLHSLTAQSHFDRFAIALKCDRFALRLLRNHCAVGEQLLALRKCSTMALLHSLQNRHAIAYRIRFAIVLAAQSHVDRFAIALHCDCCAINFILDLVSILEVLTFLLLISFALAS